MRITTICMILALVVLVAAPALSQYSAIESFNYPLGTSIDTAGGTVDGWAGPWYDVVANVQNAMIVSDTAMPYDAMSYAVQNVGNCLTSVPDTSAKEQRYARNLDKVWVNDSGRVYWISIAMAIKNSTVNSTWLGVKFYNGPGGEDGMLGKGHGLAVYTCGGGWHGSPDAECSTTPWSVGPVWLVGKVAMNGAANATMDTVYMWISPDPEGVEPSPATAVAKTFLKYNPGFDRIRIEFGGDVVAEGGLNWSIDEIRMGTSWASVSGAIVSSVPRSNGNGPSQYALEQNFPNPFNPSTKIAYSLKTSGLARLSVFDLLGREVAVLVNGVQTAGAHQATFEASRFTSGVYFYKLESGGKSLMKKMVLVK